MGMDMGALNICIWREFQIGVTGSPTVGYTVMFKFKIRSFIINVIFGCTHILKAIRKHLWSTLQMFCLQNTQMFVCVKNSRTNISCFCVYLSVMDNKYFDVVFTLNQRLNLLKNKHFLSNLQKNFVVLTNFSHTDQIFLVFLLGMRFEFDLNRHLSVIIAAFKNIQK